MTNGAQPHLVVLAVGGRRVAIRTNSSEFAGLAARVFADLTGPVTMSGPPVVFEVARHDRPIERWAIHRDGQPCELSLRTDHVAFHLQWELNRLIIDDHPASVHAAAVVARGGAVMLAGASHAGKTTLAGWLVAQHGLEPFADEVVVLDEQCRAVPYHRPLGVRTDSPLAGRLSAGAARLTLDAYTNDEQLVPMRRLSTRLARRPADVCAIVFPMRDERAATPVVAPVAAAEALVRLAAGTPGLLRHDAVVFQRLAAVARRAVALEVHYAEVAAAAPALLEALADLGCADGVAGRLTNAVDVK